MNSNLNTKPNVDLKTKIENLLNESTCRLLFNEELTPDSLEERDEDFDNEYSLDFGCTDSYGGEGMGDDYWKVYCFTDGEGTVHVKFDGYYQSYNGAEYNEWFFVEPKEVTVTRYSKVES